MQGTRSTRGCGRVGGWILVVALIAPGESAAQLVINEVLASNRLTNRDEDGDSSDWVEVLNRGPAPLELEGYSLSDDGTDPGKWRFPPLLIGAGEHLLVWCSGKDRTEPTAEAITGEDSLVPFLPTVVRPDALWRYLALRTDDPGPGPGWENPTFDDSQWPEGTAGFGYGGDEIETELDPENRVVLLRHRFRVAAPGMLRNLYLEVRFDDGLVLFLNGERVLSENFPAEEAVRPTSEADRAHSPGRVERYDLSAAIGLLVPGENVLAAAVLNSSSRSRDLFLVAALGTVPPSMHTDFRVSSGGEGIFLAAPDGAILDAVELPPQTADISFGRSPDGIGEFGFLVTPTPGAENEGDASTVLPAVAEPVFSVERGFFDAPFTVELSAATLDARLFYTLDGSAPGEESGTPYSGPIAVADTTTLRAVALAPGLPASRVITHSYIFFETREGGGVLNQPRTPEGFPRTWGPAGAADYEMDPRIATDPDSALYDPDVAAALLTHPSLSLVLDNGDLFDPATGIYANPQREGVAWERPTSVELLYPDGEPGFQINAGLRIQGDASRNPNRPKHNMRLLFKTVYGPGKLRYPFFPDSPVTEFDTIILRGGNGDSWFHPSAEQQRRAQYIRDQWHRDAQTAMGHLTTHQRYLHLYINGLYWGLYHVFERPNASFLASHLGGTANEYDAMNLGVPVDGDLEAWNEMVAIANRDPESAETYAAVQEYLDVPNLIDFLLINYYSGNVDWDHNNWFAGRRRAPGAGYKFFVWDAERSFWNFGEDRTALNNANRPTGIHARLLQNIEYRTLFADHVQRHFFGDGALTRAVAEGHWLARAEEIDLALAAEAARWGDSKRPARPYTRHVEWRAELESLTSRFFPARTELVLEQLRRRGLYPAVAAPELAVPGGLVPPGFSVALHSGEGEIYFTRDGSDPRAPGGGLAAAAERLPAGDRRAFVTAETPLRYLVPRDDTLARTWAAAEFDDSGWNDGRTPLGYEGASGYEDIIVTDLGAEMPEINASVYLRARFEVVEPSAWAFLDLRVQYDDGFVAYLNGVEVAQAHAPEDLGWDSAAAQAHTDSQAKEFEVFDLTEFRSLLEPGVNVLAVHGLNRRADDRDFLIGIELEGVTGPPERVTLEHDTRIRARVLAGGEWSALVEAEYAVEGDFPLRVTEIMYNPAPGADGSDDGFEFLELRNVSASAVDLRSFLLQGAVELDFTATAVETLAPGAYVLVVEDEDAFAERYGTEGLAVAGEYRGRLSNSGEALELLETRHLRALTLRYSDNWYAGTDGSGLALVLVDERVALDRLVDPASWGPGTVIGGTPGAGEPGGAARGLQVPGDLSQDGGLDVTDSLRLLLALFGGENAPELPCGGAGAGTAAHRELLDVDASGVVDQSDAIAILRYLFAGGAPPAAGIGCRPIAGCPDVCDE